MNLRCVMYGILLAPGLLAGCRTVHLEAPSTQAVTQPAKQALQTKKEHLKTKQKTPVLPETLGGIITSDEWVIYKDKEQEEFSGHVFYDNGVYTFQAGYALSDRKQHTITARQHVYLKQREPQGPTYEAQADRGRYNYQTGKGQLTAAGATPVRLTLTDTAQTVTARAKRIDFDTNTRVFTLNGSVFVTRVTAESTQTMQANQIIIKPQENYAYLAGNAQLSDGLRTLQADTVVYNGAKNEAHAYGARPLVTGMAEQGTFAIIADNVSSDAQGNLVTLDGRVQGWLVSPQLNNNKLNTRF